MFSQKRTPNLLEELAKENTKLIFQNLDGFFKQADSFMKENGSSNGLQLEDSKITSLERIEILEDFCLGSLLLIQAFNDTVLHNFFLETPMLLTDDVKKSAQFTNRNEHEIMEPASEYEDHKRYLYDVFAQIYKRLSQDKPKEKKSKP